MNVHFWPYGLLNRHEEGDTCTTPSVGGTSGSQVIARQNESRQINTSYNLQRYLVVYHRISQLPLVLSYHTPLPLFNTMPIRANKNTEKSLYNWRYYTQPFHGGQNVCRTQVVLTTSF